MIVKNDNNQLHVAMATKLKPLCSSRLYIFLKGVNIQDLGRQSPIFKVVEVSSDVL